MPVKRTWYEIREIIGTKNVKGILHYGVIFKGWERRTYWEPFYNLNYEARHHFHEKLSNVQKNARNERYLRYQERKWGWHPLNNDEFDEASYVSSSQNDDASITASSQNDDETIDEASFASSVHSSSDMSESTIIKTNRRVNRKPKW